ncbi:MAG: hypothetical protein NZT92_06690 [Abditibacteriales bacterium]|nr:hypothetical protein [Abditibacteriales bacterium]MDW8365633.1 hypothetical protein [Abditibacteriales bacterium]
MAVLLPQITKLTGVPLLWDKNIADLRASVFMQSQPASQVLIHLAFCLRLVWKREADGYRLYRPSAITRSDERQRRAWEEARSKQTEEKRQLDEFTTALLRQSHLTDEEVKDLAAKFPYVAKTLKEQPWFVVGLRVATWLTPEQWDKALERRLKLDYKEWTQTGPDPDLPVPKLDLGTVKLVEATLRQQGKEPGRVAIEKPPGRSGIDSIWVSVQPDGSLSVSVEYVFAGGFSHHIQFGLGSVRDRR